MDGSLLAWILLVRRQKQITQPSESKVLLSPIVLVPRSTTDSALSPFSFANRLTNIKENYKFRKGGKDGQRIEDPARGIRHVVDVIKEEHSVKYETMSSHLLSIRL